MRKRQIFEDLQKSQNYLLFLQLFLSFDTGLEFA